MPQQYNQYVASNPRYRQTARRKRGRVWRTVFWVAAVALVLSLVALGAIAFSYWKGQSVYDEVADSAFETPLSEQQVNLADLTVNWDALLAVNPDTVGWLYIPETNINYPIVQGSDNVRYLTHDFQGNRTFGWEATYGTPFLLASNASDFSDKNNVIQAHNMNNGAMFADLMSFDDSAVFNEHRDVYLLTPKGNYLLNGISMVKCSGTEAIVRTEFSSAEDFAEYVQDKLDRSMVQPDPAAPAASEVERLFMFSTCADAAGTTRYVLFCEEVDFAAVNTGTGNQSSMANVAGIGMATPNDAPAKEAE